MKGRLELDLLRSFLMVCKVGSFSSAAEKLFISQPALSRKIQALEEIVGCTLIDRGKKKGMSLTESGYLLQIRAQKIVALAEELVEELEETGTFLSGNVRVGCVESKALQSLANIISSFKALYPHVNVELILGDGDSLRSGLDNQQLDMVVLLEPVEAAKYKRITLPIRDCWDAVIPKDNFPVDKKDISPEELASMPLILPRRSIVRDELCEVLGIQQSQLKIGAFHNLPSAGIALVKAGLGTMVCVGGSFDARGDMNLCVLPVRLPISVRHVLARQKNKPLSKAAEIFWSTCEKTDEWEI